MRMFLQASVGWCGAGLFKLLLSCVCLHETTSAQVPEEKALTGTEPNTLLGELQEWQPRSEETRPLMI